MTHGVEFYGKFWILPGGHIIDCSTDEHARVARAAMLGIKRDGIARELPLNTIFKPLTDEQAQHYLDRNANPDAIEFLRSDPEMVDPRVFMIKYHGWIRQRENEFFAWKWDMYAKHTIVSAKDFWSQQKKVTPKTWVTLYNVADQGYESGEMSTLWIERFLGSDEC